MIERLIVFGATGDLTGRFLLPALAQLASGGELPDGFTILGAAQEEWDDDAFRRHGREQLEQHGADVPAGVRKAVVDRLRYRQVDVTQQDSVQAVIAAVTDEDQAAPVVAYLALPTGLIPSTVTALGAAALPANSRIAVEKPFGEDLQSARDLNALLARTIGEDWEQAAFRVDHALGMITVQNLLPLRFANRVLDSLWNSEHVAEIVVLWEETLALEGRAAFYDRAGALKDVMQNHMMQVFCMIAMERPDSVGDGFGSPLSVDELRRHKVELLRSVRELSASEIAATSRRARYTAGRLAGSGGADGREVPAYVAEQDVDPDRNTETYAEVVLTVENPRWAGTTFRLRAGKALEKRRKGILVRFRPGYGAQDISTYDEGLWIGVDGPNDVSLRLNTLATDDLPGPATLTLTGRQPESRLSPYAHVLLNLLQGRSNLSVGSEEAEQAWRILTPVREAWDDDVVPMEEYPAGSAGLPR